MKRLSETKEVRKWSNHPSVWTAIRFPNTRKDDAIRVVERMGANGGESAADSGNGKIVFSFSGGVTEVQKADNNIDHVIQRADQILYEVKKGGGNSLASG